ncbi:MAG: hypothetical protein KatS3mg105_4050 [Gemmatales bacterium]|nr:MAG: hypothetical protein KatS3mg105_4050 [Gemmatales bacterium]
MPWLVGIDEAGYGPNLGPLVMTAVACQVPAARLAADWWHILQNAVRSQQRSDARMVIADSKQVYNPQRGLANLECSVLALLEAGPTTFADLLKTLSPDARQADEIWYRGTTRLPVACPVEVVARAASDFHSACERNELRWVTIRSVLIGAEEFNFLVDETGTKSAVLGHALIRLLKHFANDQTTSEALTFFVDKHGGRNYYAALLQEAISDGVIMVREESSKRSTYQLVGGQREWTIHFQPRADADHFCVALASMVSKYVREIWMNEFNGFWRRHIPRLKATAGYPVDARRFFAEIEPLCEKLGITKNRIWRKR